MRSAAKLALIASCFVVLPLRGQIEIPTAADGYSISITSNTSENAPAGYTGRIEKMEHFAVGREPNVIGRTPPG